MLTVAVTTVIGLVVAGCKFLVGLMTAHFREFTRRGAALETTARELEEAQEQIRATEIRLEHWKRVAKRQRQAKLKAKRDLLEELQRQLARRSSPPTSSATKK